MRRTTTASSQMGRARALTRPLNSVMKVRLLPPPPSMWMMKLAVKSARNGGPVTIDYKYLLAKYIRYVRDCEGTDFIEGGYRGYPGDQDFSGEEWCALEKANKVEV